MQETKKRLKSLSSYINGTSSETLSRVKTPHNLPVEKVLKLYKSGYNIRLTEALGERYKSVWKCLGDEEFFLRCEEYIKHSPSTSYNLAEYGNAFPHFLEEKYLDSEFKFIGDIARVDLFFMELFHSRDDDCLDSENFFQLCQLASENFQFQHTNP